MGQTVSFLPNTTLKFHAKYQIFGTLKVKNMGFQLQRRYPLVLDCFIIFLRCIEMVSQASHTIYRPVIVHTVSFYQRQQLTNFMQNIRFGASTPYMKWDTVLQGGTYIAAGVFDNLPYMHKED